MMKTYQFAVALAVAAGASAHASAEHGHRAKSLQSYCSSIVYLEGHSCIDYAKLCGKGKDSNTENIACTSADVITCWRFGFRTNEKLFNCVDEFARRRAYVPADSTEPNSATQSPSILSRLLTSEMTVFNFGNYNKTCVAWSDGCVSCRRINGEQGQCSNTGIACQPEEIRCLAPK